MVFAHSCGIENSPLSTILSGEGDRLVHLIYMLGEAAPILFFPVAGITAYLQTRRYSPKPVILSYVFLFLLGFSYNGITQGDFYSNFLLEMIQIIALGACLVYIIQYVIKPAPAMYLTIALAIFALKLLNDHVTWLNGLMTVKRGLIVPPGVFPLLPWLFLFFIGVFAYSARNFYNAIMAGTSISLLFLLKFLSFPLELWNKWDMSLGYFLLSCFMLLSVFYVVRRFEFFRNENAKEMVLFWGKYSLLFLFVHKFVIRLLHTIAGTAELYSLLSNPYLFWFLTIVITTFLMKLILRLPSDSYTAKFFQNIWIWLLWVVLIFLVPLLIWNQTTIYVLELLLGIVFAVYYPQLNKLLKQSKQVVAA